MNKFLYLLIASVMLISACKKEITILKEVPIVHSWSLDSSLFSVNKILFTSLRLNDSVLAVANSNSIWYINANKLNKSIDGAYFNFNPTYGFLVSPEITSTMGVTLIDSNHLKVFSTLSPVSNYGSFVFTPAYTSAVNSVKGLPLPKFPAAGYPIINSKYILAPTEINYIDQKLYCSLIQVDFSSNPFPNTVRFSSSRTVTLAPGPGTIGFGNGGYFSAGYYDKFFLADNYQFYRIDTLGNVKAFGNGPVSGVQGNAVFQMFELNDHLFAIGGSKFFVSQDKGENWSLFFDASGTFYTDLSYFNVGSELYATFQSQIWRVTLSGSTLNYKELDNDGLQTSYITSINKTGKYAFVTTLSGLFYRDTATFNQPKK